MPRRITFDVIHSTLNKNQSFDEAFNQHPRLNKLEPRDRNLAYNISITTLRRLGQINNIIDKCLEISNFDFFVPFEGKGNSFKHTKTNVIRELGEDHPFSYNFPNVFSGLLTIARKSNISNHFLNDWKKACEKEEWIDGKTYGDLDPRFKWQCPEQSILGIIISNWIRKQQYNISPYYPNIMFGGKIIKNIIVLNENSINMNI